jgi:hypothetical protein
MSKGRFEMAKEMKEYSLGVARKVLKTLIILNVGLGGFGILILLIALIVAPAQFASAMHFDLAAGGAKLMAAITVVMIIGLSSVPITHVILIRLLAIVDSVGAGDPFIRANAVRLQTIAWSLLALQLLNIVVHVAVRAGSASAPFIHVGFSIAGWLSVLLLFVLARVFEQGAAMREDLEGTI